jgi:hypothetical protein
MRSYQKPMRFRTFDLRVADRRCVSKHEVRRTCGSAWGSAGVWVIRDRKNAWVLTRLGFCFGGVGSLEGMETHGFPFEWYLSLQYNI